MFTNLNPSDDKDKARETLNKMKNESDIQFWIGNPSVDLISGILHLRPFVAIPKGECPVDLITSNILVIVSIPNSKDVIELYQMVREFHNDIQIIRVLKTSFMHHYSLIIKFNAVKAANSFYLKNNQTRFNSIENDICIIREVDHVEMKKEKVDLFPKVEIVQESTRSLSEEILSKDIDAESQEIKREWQNITAYENQYNCPICLETIFDPQKPDKLSPSLVKKSSRPGDTQGETTVDLTTHLISILCGHFFHISCLEKWKDSKCPVCRYNQHPLESSKCDFCGTNENLWMCIICGFIGCTPEGPTNGHIKEHNDMTKHIYAVELETKGVFDFSKNRFVQRLLQNIRDGKIIQHEGEGTPTANEKSLPNEELEKRLDTIIYEYNILLSSQYQSQKEYYQEQLKNASLEHEMKLKRQEEEIRQLQEQEKEAFEEFQKEEQELEKNKKEFFDVKEIFLKVDQERKELEAINKKLTAQQSNNLNEQKSNMMNQSEELESLRAQVAAVTREIKDFEAYLITQNRIQKAISKEGLDTESSHILMGSKSTKGKKKGSKL